MQLTSQNVHFPKQWAYSPGTDYETFMSKLDQENQGIQKATQKPVDHDLDRYKAILQIFTISGLWGKIVIKAAPR